MLTRNEWLEHFSLVADEYGYDDLEVTPIIDKFFGPELADEWLMIRSGLKEVA